MTPFPRRLPPTTSRTHCGFLAAASWLLAATLAASPPAPAPDDAVIRQQLTAVNHAWSAARLAYDKAAMERLLAPEFYAALRDRRLSREEFVARVSQRSPAARLLRFDNPILIVMHEPDKDEWVVVVQEKLEVERTNPDGTKELAYSLWVTRDGLRRTAPDSWQFIYTQEVGHESWTQGKKPPFPDWQSAPGHPAA